MFLLSCEQTAVVPSCLRAADGVIDAEISADGRYVMVLYESGRVSVWDTEGDRLALDLQDDHTKVISARLSPAATYLLTVSDDGVTQLWSVGNGNEAMRFSGYEYQISAIRFSHDERHIVAGCEDGTVYFWRVGDPDAERIQTGQRDYPITAIDISRDSRKALSVSHLGRSIVEWDIATGSPIAYDKLTEENRPMPAVYSPCGNYIVQPMIHGLAETRILRAEEWPRDELLESARFMSSRLDGMEQRSSIPILTPREELDGNWATRAVFSPDGNTLALLHNDSTIVLWDWHSRQRMHSIVHEDDMLTRIGFSSDSRYLITAPGIPSGIIPDGSVFDARITRIYDVRGASEALVLFGHNDLVMAADIAANGASIMTASKDGQVLIWSASEDKLRAARNSEETTPIVAALRAEAARILAADPAIPEHLEQAVINGCCADISALLEAGANPNAIADGGMPMLLEAVRTNQVEAATILLRGGAHANQIDESGQSPLQLAALKGNCDLVRLLLEHGADVDARVEPGALNALHLAVWTESAKSVRLLLEAGADPGLTFARLDRTFPPSGAETALTRAAEIGNETIVRMLLEHKAPVDAATEHGRTALHFAVEEGTLKLVQLLIESGANPDPETVSNTSPLNIAIDNRRDDIAELLLAAGAEVRFDSKTATSDLFEIAKNGGSTTVVRQLLAMGANPTAAVKGDFTPLHIAASQGNAEVVQIMLEDCDNVDAELNSGATPLLCAAPSGHTEVVRILLRAGADPTAKTSFGESPLKAAIRNRHADTIAALLDAGAPMDESSDAAESLLNLAAAEGSTELIDKLFSMGTTASLGALVHASASGHCKVVETLLAAGAGNTEVGSGAWTPLMLAAKGGHDDTVLVLLNSGFDVHAENYEGQTALHIAAGAGDCRTVQTLLEAGAEIDATTNIGASPLYLAAESGHAECVTLLVAKGAQADLTCDSGMTALRTASSNGHTGVVQALLQANTKQE